MEHSVDVMLEMKCFLALVLGDSVWTVVPVPISYLQGASYSEEGGCCWGSFESQRVVVIYPLSPWSSASRVPPVLSQPLM